MEIESSIKEWVQLDNNLKRLNNEALEIRKKKTNLTENIFKYLNENNMNNTVINISDGKLNFVNSLNYSILSYKFLEDCLNEYYNDKDKTKDMIDFIKNKRKINYVKSIKRTYK